MSLAEDKIDNTAAVWIDWQVCRAAEPACQHGFINRLAQSRPPSSQAIIEWVYS